MNTLERLVDILPRLKNRVQITGLVVIVAAFVVVRLLAPQEIPAQITAGGIGVLFIVFGQVFQYLHLIPPRQRVLYMLILFAGFIVFVLALLTITIVLVKKAPDPIEQSHYNKLLHLTSGAQVSLCQADPRASVVQLFKHGWLLIRFSTQTLYAIQKRLDGTLSWKKNTDASTSINAPCDGVPNERLLEWGFRWWYCSGADGLRDMLGEPLSSEQPGWVQFQTWTKGLLAYGLPGTAREIDSGRFLQLHGVFLDGEAKSEQGNGSWLRVTQSNTEQRVWCTSLWHRAPRIKGEYPYAELPQSLKEDKTCPKKIPPKRYVNGGERCSLFGF